MEECNFCLSRIKKRNKNNHEQSKKYKYFSKQIINNCFVRNPEIDKFEGILQAYYDEHKKFY